MTCPTQITSSLYIGMMSGTSLDDISSVIARIHPPEFEILATHRHPYPIHLRNALKDLITTQQTSLENLGTIDHELGLCYAEAVNALLSESQISAKNIIAIGCHGQTICHHPNPPASFSLQIGDPNLIAYHTGIPVVFDFRRQDMARGGQGAPLAPLLHQAAFSKAGRRRAIVNLGGIANMTCLEGTQITYGFDTGPGNGLLDAWTQNYFQSEYDDQGSLARQGTSSPSLLQRLLSDPYFDQPPPKSTGKEYFNLAWLQKHLLSTPDFYTEAQRKNQAKDVLATLTELTAQSLQRTLHDIHFQPDELYICGGGAFNTFLMERIAQHLEIPVYTTDALGIAPEWVEPLLMAFLCAAHYQADTLDLASITGSIKPFIIGCQTAPKDHFQ